MSGHGLIILRYENLAPRKSLRDTLEEASDLTSTHSMLKSVQALNNHYLLPEDHEAHAGVEVKPGGKYTPIHVHSISPDWPGNLSYGFLHSAASVLGKMHKQPWAITASPHSLKDKLRGQPGVHFLNVEMSLFPNQLNWLSNRLFDIGFKKVFWVPTQKYHSKFYLTRLTMLKHSPQFGPFTNLVHKVIEKVNPIEFHSHRGTLVAISDKKFATKSLDFVLRQMAGPDAGKLPIKDHIVSFMYHTPKTYDKKIEEFHDKNNLNKPLNVQKPDWWYRWFKNQPERN